MDYFGARYYESLTGRWMQVDPMADEYPDVSPYVYCNDNPISILDLFGMDTTSDIYYPAPKPLPEVVVTAPREDNAQQAQVTPLPFPEPLPIPFPMPMPITFDRPVTDRAALLKYINNIINNFPIAIGGTSGLSPVRVNISNLFSEDSKTIGEILKGKKGSIKNAPLPPGSPSWEEMESKTMGRIKSWC